MAAFSVLLSLGAAPLLFIILAGLEEGGDAECPDWRAAFLESAVLWGVLLTVISNGLSLFTALNRSALSLTWGAVLTGLVVYGWRNGRTAIGWASVRTLIRKKTLPKAESTILAIIVVLAAVSLIIALVAPPNTNDSLRYHMSRVMHWQQNQSLAHYNTPIESQLWMPPYSEMAILNMVVLSGSDQLANTVQWLAMIGSLVGVSWMAKQMGARVPEQVLSIVFAFSLPMGILQSTSTQNDYTTAFWAVCLVAFVIRDLKGKPSAWMIGLSAGLGVLTKGTFFPYAAVFLLAWGVGMLVQKECVLFHRTRRCEIPGHLLGRLVRSLVVVILGVLVLNSYFWWQNMRTFGFPLGPVQPVRHLTNESFTPGAIFSNLIRNSTLHLGTPYGIINGNLQAVVEHMHQWIGQDVNDPATTLDDYRVKRYLTEDRASNPWHFLAIPFLGVTAWGRRRLVRRMGSDVTTRERTGKHRSTSNQGAGWYALSLLVVFMLFSVLYKWQSTGSRLQLAWFVLLAPLAGVLWGWLATSRRWYALTAFLLMAALSPIFTNPSRPFLPFRGDPQTIWNTPRETLFFRNNPVVQDGYVSLMNELQTIGCDQVGLRIDSSDPEYLIWTLSADSTVPVRFEHLFPDPPVAGGSMDDFSPCAVICTICTEASLDGLTFHSAHPGNLRLYTH